MNVKTTKGKTIKYFFTFFILVITKTTRKKLKTIIINKLKNCLNNNEEAKGKNN